MKKMSVLILFTFFVVSTLNTVAAQSEKNALVPLPSVDDFTKGEDGWAFGLGLGVEYETALR
jgi:hypothetical protein